MAILCSKGKPKLAKRRNFLPEPEMRPESRASGTEANEPDTNR
jgi:hypothetical protein